MKETKFNEKKLTALFSKYFRTHPNDLLFGRSFVVEFKLVHGKTLNLTRHMQPQQVPCLARARHNGLYHKISDVSPGLKPFDASFWKDNDAYVAVLFVSDKERSRSPLYFIDINTVLFFKLFNNKIKESDADALCVHKINL
jgi:hypothetical protein